MNNPLVSVVVPIYNMGDKIEHCIQSILKQDYNNFEVVLVDDGSKDNSLEVCNKLAKNNSSIKVVHTENRGSGPARNTGIENSRGEYIYFPDADDYIEPETLSTLVKAMEGGKYDLVVFGFKSVNTKGEMVGTKTYPDLAQEGDFIRSSYADYMTTSSRLGIQGAPWNKFFKSSIIRDEVIEFPPLRRHQDEGFIGRYMCHVKNVHFIQNVLYTYYTNDLKLEWKKYPVDYIDAVIGLNNVRKETILTWNPCDTVTREMIQREYICNVIKALELSFSPKMGFDREKRTKWIKEKIKETKIKEVVVPSILGFYQKLMLLILKIIPFPVFYFSLWIKIKAESFYRNKV